MTILAVMSLGDLQEARQELSSAEEMLETSRSIAENAQRTLARIEAEAAAGSSFSANPNAANFVQQQAAMQEVGACTCIGWCTLH